MGELAKSDRRILILDIETAPNMAAVYDCKTSYVSPKNFTEDQRILCWAAKWVGESKVLFADEHHDGRHAMLETAYDLVNSADILVGYNSQSFDWKWLETEFWLEGWKPPTPVQHVDLYRASKRFRFASHGLEHIAGRLDLGVKAHHDGIQTWLGCMAGDEKAWRNMRRYNVEDVRLTERLYERMLPWITHHPHVKNSSQEVPTCNKCGSTDLTKAGTYTAKVLTYAMYRCNKCSGLVRAGHRLGRVGHTVGVK